MLFGDSFIQKKKVLIPALAFQRKIYGENTNVHGQTQIQSLQILGWGMEKDGSTEVKMKVREAATFSEGLLHPS